MAQYDTSTYGEQIADIYDDLYGEIENVDAMAEFLEALAKGGRALELGIGTGTVALPLAKSGVEVHGIDASPAMVAKMRAKAGGPRDPRHHRQLLSAFRRRRIQGYLRCIQHLLD